MGHSPPPAYPIVSDIQQDLGRPPAPVIYQRVSQPIGPEPMLLDCPVCHQQVLSQTEPVVGLLTYLLSAAFVYLAASSSAAASHVACATAKTSSISAPGAAIISAYISESNRPGVIQRIIAQQREELVRNS